MSEKSENIERGTHVYVLFIAKDILTFSPCLVQSTKTHDPPFPIMQCLFVVTNLYALNQSWCNSDDVIRSYFLWLHKTPRESAAHDFYGMNMQFHKYLLLFDKSVTFSWDCQRVSHTLHCWISPKQQADTLLERNIIWHTHKFQPNCRIIQMVTVCNVIWVYAPQLSC